MRSEGDASGSEESTREDGTRVPKRVLTSTAWLITGRLLGSACTVVTLLVLARSLEEAAFGRLTFWLSVFLVLDGLVDLGSGQVLVRRAAADWDSAGSALRTARRMRLGIASIVVLAVAATGFAIERGEAWFLVIAALYQVSHVLELSTLGWRDAIAWRSPVLVRATAAVTSLTFVLALLQTGEERPLAYLVAIAAGSTIGNFLLHAFGRKSLPPTAGAKAAPLGPFVRAAIPLGAAAVCQQLYFHVDHVFVRVQLGDEAVGRYNVAVRLMSLAIMGGVFAASAALPWLSRAHARGELAAAARRLTTISALAGAAVAILVALVRVPVLELFGESFLAAESSLVWLLVAAWLVHLGAPLLTAVVASGRGGAVLAIAASGLALNLVGNALLVPRHGIEGAAIATAFTEGWVALTAGVVIARLREPNS